MKTMISSAIVLFFILNSCQVSTSPAIWRVQSCNDVGCDNDNDGNCCESAECEQRFCSADIVQAFLRVGPGKICDVVQGCLPPVDIRELLILVYTDVVKETLYEFRSVKNQGIYARSSLKSFDEQTGIATFVNEIINEEMVNEELVLSIQTFYKSEKGQVNSLKMETKTFPAGFFSPTQ